MVSDLKLIKINKTTCLDLPRPENQKIISSHFLLQKQHFPYLFCTFSSILTKLQNRTQKIVPRKSENNIQQFSLTKTAISLYQFASFFHFGTKR